MKRWTGGARSRVSKKKHQQTQLEFFQKRGSKRPMSSASSSNMIHDFPSKHIPSSTENASYPLDIHFLLRTQLQKKRRSKHLEGGSENDLEEHVCLLTRKNHNEDENLSLSSLESTSLKQQDEVETSDSEGDFENVIRFIDEGVDKTEQLGKKVPSVTSNIMHCDNNSTTINEKTTKDSYIEQLKIKSMPISKCMSSESTFHKGESNTNSTVATELGLFELEDDVASSFLTGQKKDQLNTQEDDILLEDEDEMEIPSPNSTSLFHLMRELERVKKENRQLKQTILELQQRENNHSKVQ